MCRGNFFYINIVISNRITLIIIQHLIYDFPPKTLVKFAAYQHRGINVTCIYIYIYTLQLRIITYLLPSVYYSTITIRIVYFVQWYVNGFFLFYCPASVNVREKNENVFPLLRPISLLPGAISFIKNRELKCNQHRRFCNF